MTNEELIVKIVKENCELRFVLKESKKLAYSIVNASTCIGAPLNDNILRMDNKQRKFVYDQCEKAREIIDTVDEVLKDRG